MRHNTTSKQQLGNTYIREAFIRLNFSDKAMPLYGQNTNRKSKCLNLFEFHGEQQPRTDEK